MTEMALEFIEDHAIVITRARAQVTAERLMLVAVAMSKVSHAYDYGHNGEEAQARERWALLTYGAVAALDDPAEYYRRAGKDPERAAVLGARVSLAMRHSKWGVPEDELGNAMAISTTQGVPAKEFPTLMTLAMLAIEAAEDLRGEVSAETLPVKCLTAQTVDGTEEGEPRRWAGLLAARLDRPDLLELETKHVMLTTLAALIDRHDGISDWIPRDRDPSVRIREPRDHPGLPLIVTPFVMETKDAWEAVEAGGVVDQAFVETSPTVQALRAELAHGPARAS